MKNKKPKTAASAGLWNFRPPADIQEMWAQYVRVVYGVVWNSDDKRQRGWRTKMINEAIRRYLVGEIRKSDMNPDRQRRLELATDEALANCVEVLALRRANAERMNHENGILKPCEP